MYLTDDDGGKDRYELLNGPDDESDSTNFVENRDPKRGFNNLHRDLVINLPDDAQLTWGAIDFGSMNGDVMHFDVRRRGIWAGS